MTLSLPYPFLKNPEVQANFETLAMQFPVVAGVPWAPFPGAVNWAAYGAPFQVPQYTRDGLGRVHLRGVLRNMVGWAAGAVAGTLPAGFAPPATLIFVTSAATGVTRLDINAAGNVIPAAAGAAGAYLSLDGISFSTDP